MNNLNLFSRISFLVYIFFYLISAEFAISRNTKDEVLIRLENSLNKRDIVLISKIFSDQETFKLTNKFSKLIHEFPNSKWQIKNLKNKNDNNHIIEVKLSGSKIIDDKEFLLESNFNYLFSLENGVIFNSSIKNHLTTIRNDNNKLDIDIEIPNKVLTGKNYYIDVIINNPLENEIIAGYIKEYEEETLINQSILLKPLVSGGIYKITRAPSKPGIQIWTGIIAHPKGLISFTKTVDVIEKF